MQTIQKVEKVWKGKSTFISQPVEVDERMATELRDNAEYEGQRPLNGPNVNKYAQAMREGRFCSIPLTITVAHWMNKKYLLDGNTRIHALLQAIHGDQTKGIPANPDLVMPTTLTEIFVDDNDIEEVSAIYGLCDIGRKRLNFDYARAAGFGTKFISPERAKKGYAAIGAVMGNFGDKNNATIQSGDVVAEALKWEDVVAEYFDEIIPTSCETQPVKLNGKEKNAALRTVLENRIFASEMIYLLQHAKQTGDIILRTKVIEFVHNIACPEKRNIKVGSPEFIYLNWAVNNHKDFQRIANRIYTANAWNHWFLYGTGRGKKKSFDMKTDGGFYLEGVPKCAESYIPEMS